MKSNKTYHIIVFVLLVSFFFACNSDTPSQNDPNFSSQPYAYSQDSARYKGIGAYQGTEKVIHFYPSEKEALIKNIYFEKNNLKNGAYINYFKNGLTNQKGTYKSGKKEGLWTYFYYTKDSKISKKEKEVHYKNDLKNGLYTEWHQNGQKKKQITYQDDNQEGIGLTWYENGQKSSEMFFEDHLPEGENKMWFENGQLKALAVFRQGKREGIVKGWYENGQLKREMPHKNGVRHGKFKLWRSNGEPMGHGEYQMGEMIESVEF